MSLPNTKTFLTGVLLAIVLTMGGAAMAFTPEGGRLWKPYQPESFGGQRRSADGFYVSVEGILWRVDGPRNIPIGYRNPDGTSGTRAVYAGTATMIQNNSMNTSNLSTDFALGTRVEVGNIRGHHGWLFSGYGLSDCSGGFEEGTYQSPFSNTSGNNNNNSSSSSSSSSNNDNNNSNQIRGSFSTMVIQDSLTLSTYPYFGSPYRWNDIWQDDWSFYRIYPTSEDYDFEQPEVINNIGYFWGWVPVESTTGTGTGTGTGTSTGTSTMLPGLRLAPLPINFSFVDVANTTDIINLELMYTYRPHPFKWGEMEILGGARYWDFDDAMKFSGLSFSDEELDVGNNSNNSSSSSSSSSSSNDNDSGMSVAEEKELEELYLSSLKTTITGRVQNRVVGPQIGVKMFRRNARWTFGAEGRFMAGINSQSHTVSGTFATQFMDSGNNNSNSSSSSGSSSSSSSSSNRNNNSNSVMHPYQMLGLYNNQRAYYHHKNRTVFSPGFELRLTAKWQWTDAVGVQLGFNTTIFDNIARGADIIEYKVYDDGQLLGFRKSDQTVIVYGLNFGLNIRR